MSLSESELEVEKKAFEKWYFEQFNNLGYDFTSNSAMFVLLRRSWLARAELVKSKELKKKC